MGTLRENINLGLVTSRIPDDLMPGELQVTNNLIYVPSLPSLKVAPSRLFDAASTNLGATISGLRFCSFDFVPVYCELVSGSTALTTVTGFTIVGVTTGAKVYGDGIAAGTTYTVINSTSGTLSIAATQTIRTFVYFQADNYLVAQIAGAYHVATLPASSTTLTFASLASVTAGDTLESVHYSNEHFLLNGKNANLVFKSNKTTRAHGLQPITQSPEAAVTTSGGTWTLPSGTGLYSYWTTEVDKSNVVRKTDGTIVGEGIESTFEGTPTVANIVSTSYFVTIKRPARVNTSATHWRAYRSFRMTSTTAEKAAKEVVFPDGYLIGEAEMKDDGTQETIIDGKTTASNAANLLPTVTEVNSGPVTWTNPGNAFVDDGVNFATLDTTTLTALQKVYLRYGSFGFTTSTITPPIVGIVIKIKGKVTAGTWPSIFRVKPVVISATGTVSGAASAKPVTFTTTNTEYTLPSSAGSDITTDLWGLKNLSPSDFADGKFGVEIQVGGSTFAGTISIDSVKATLYYNQGQQTGTLELFPKITVAPFGVEASVGRNGPPPVASTGDVFQDSLVLNDVIDESMVKYSFPTLVDYFPRPYFLNFETKEQDTVTNIKSVGNVCVVGLRHQIYRINYLPRETDAEFDRGRAVELIETHHGIVGTQAATLVSFPGQPQQLAYISQYGLHVTDGYRTRSLSGDLNWAGIGITPLTKVILINNPELYTLELAYSTNGSTNNKVLYFSYHPMHIKENGMLKVSGPVDYAMYSATVGYPARSTGDFGITKLYSGSSTNIVEEEQSFGTTYAGGVVNGNTAGGGAAKTFLVPTFTTRRMRASGFGNEWEAKEFYIAYTGSSGEVISATPSLYRTDKAAVAVTAQSFTSASTKQIGVMIFSNLGEGIEYVVAPTINAASTLGFDYLVVVGEGFGGEEGD